MPLPNHRARERSPFFQRLHDDEEYQNVDIRPAYNKINPDNSLRDGQLSFEGDIDQLMLHISLETDEASWACPDISDPSSCRSWKREEQ